LPKFFRIFNQNLSLYEVIGIINMIRIWEMKVGHLSAEMTIENICAYMRLIILEASVIINY